MSKLVYIPEGTPLTVPVINNKGLQSIFGAISPQLQQIVGFSSERAMAILTSIPDRSGVCRSSYFFEKLNLSPDFDNNLQIAGDPLFLADRDYSIDLSNLEKQEEQLVG